MAKVSARVLAARVAAHDWSKTPLGARETWSPSLKLIVATMMASQFPMALRWGPQFVIICNDGYLPILGGKHPEALGARFQCSVATLDLTSYPGGKEFIDAYQAKYGEAPDYLDSSLPWMSLEILQTAVAKAGLDKEKIRQIVSTETFDTINGKVKFDGVQNAITPTAFVQMQKGKLQIVWPKSIATATYEPKKGW